MTPSTQTGVAIAPPRAIEQYVSEDATITFEEARRLFFLYARHEKFIQRLGTYSEREIAQCAFNFMMIIHVACKEHLQETRSLKTFASAQAFLRKVSGLEDAVDWLKADPQRLLHVQESGSETAFKDLYHLRPTQQLVELSTYDLFHQAALDHKTWFSFAEYAFNTMEKNVLSAFFENKKGVSTTGWNKRRFFFTFLLSLHIPSTIRPFTLEEIYQLVGEIREDHEAWLQSFNLKLQNLEDDKLAQMILRHGDMRRLLQALKERSNQTTQFIATEVNLRKADHQLFNEMEKATTPAISLASWYQYDLYSPIKSADPAEEMKGALVILNRKLAELHPSRLAHILARHEWIAPWLNKKNIERAYLASINRFKTNLAILETRADTAALAEVKAMMETPWTVGEAIQALWDIRPHRSSIRTFLPRADSWSVTPDLREWTNVRARQVLSGIMKDAFETVSLSTLGPVLIELHRDWKFELPKRFLSIGHWLGLMLAFGKELPDYIQKYVSKEDWFKYVCDDSARIWMAKKVDALTVTRIREQLPGRYDGDFQEVIASIKGFTIEF